MPGRMKKVYHLPNTAAGCLDLHKSRDLVYPIRLWSKLGCTRNGVGFQAFRRFAARGLGKGAAVLGPLSALIGTGGFKGRLGGLENAHLSVMR